MPLDPLRVRFQLTYRGHDLRSVEKLDITPKLMTAGATCFDLFAAETMIVNHGVPTLIPCGFRIEIPSGFEGIVRSRSGNAKTGRLVAWGTIDSDFRGEVLACCYVNGVSAWTVGVGDRIAQLAIRPVPDVLLEEVGQHELLSATERGDKGWGSTGKSG